MTKRTYITSALLTAVLAFPLTVYGQSSPAASGATGHAAPTVTMNAQHTATTAPATVKTTKMLISTGFYNGQQDPHTIEIETNGVPDAYQISDELAAKLDQLPEGGVITFEYMVKTLPGEPELQQRILVRAAPGYKTSLTASKTISH
ncbi:hypothetical protein [Paenibacillus lacisoli]|nr:hypothetical protein [Paenibacillus sp. JX-17]